ncbi:flagellar hook-length control protein FliK [Thermotoga sp.]|uniref:flagellar hook-length control protein FliK n=1 Tax=Thermotoga sp. TaxID=28240 RepID=UPI0025EA8441|nr:flagellar hook-length control protein FliK [Thermotoga sp.]MCD6551403.1 flagellar hook-length control protein FliK [Thermotoga sp.]
MDVWRVIGRYNNVLVLSKKNSVLVLEINGKIPKVGESVRVWYNRILTGKELKAKLLAHFDEELAFKIFKTPGLLGFLYEISSGFEKKYIHFLKMFVKHVVPKRFLEITEEKKRILKEFLPKALETRGIAFSRKFSLREFFRFVDENFSRKTTPEVDDKTLKRAISMRKAIFSSEDHDVYQLDLPSKKGIVRGRYILIPFKGKTILIMFKKEDLPFVSFCVKKDLDLSFLKSFLKGNVTVEKRKSSWSLVWRGREVIEFDLPDKEIIPKPERISDQSVMDAVFLINDLLDESVRFLSLPSFGVSEIWWEKSSSRAILVVNTSHFGKVVADVFLEEKNLSVRFYAERNLEELSLHAVELKKDLESIGLFAQLFFSRKDPMIWEGFNAYG